MLCNGMNVVLMQKAIPYALYIMIKLPNYFKWTHQEVQVFVKKFVIHCVKNLRYYDKIRMFTQADQFHNNTTKLGTARWQDMKKNLPSLSCIIFLYNILLQVSYKFQHDIEKNKLYYISLYPRKMKFHKAKAVVSEPQQSKIIAISVIYNRNSSNPFFTITN